MEKGPSAPPWTPINDGAEGSSAIRMCRVLLLPRTASLRQLSEQDHVNFASCPRER